MSPVLQCTRMDRPVCQVGLKCFKLNNSFAILLVCWEIRIVWVSVRLDLRPAAEYSAVARIQPVCISVQSVYRTLRVKEDGFYSLKPERGVFQYKCLLFVMNSIIPLPYIQYSKTSGKCQHWSHYETQSICYPWAKCPNFLLGHRK